MSDYKVYNPNTDKPIIKQKRANMYYVAGEEALYNVIDIRLVNYEWIHLASWTNETDQTAEYEYTFQNSDSIVGGEEFDTKWDLKEVLKGLSAVINGSVSSITEGGGPTTGSSKLSIRVWANSSAHLYQKRYTLNPVVWFQFDSDHVLWTVGERNGPGVASQEASVEVNTRIYLTTTKALEGSLSVPVVQASDIYNQKNIKQLQDCSDKCQDCLKKHGV